jgi:hypothetical protein
MHHRYGGHAINQVIIFGYPRHIMLNFTRILEKVGLILLGWLLLPYHHGKPLPHHRKVIGVASYEGPANSLTSHSLREGHKGELDRGPHA